jgi:peptidoglycan/xylan/chitin deacetylase (PgdA/CDA1 family)
MVTLSFDDGYAETIQSVRRILEDHDFKATFNIIVGLVGVSLREQNSASWDDLRRLVAAGNEIASHGMFHLPLGSSIKSRTGEFSRLFSNQPIRALSILKHQLGIHPAYIVKNVDNTHELESSKKIIEKNIPSYKCVSFAYPSGNYDKKSRTLVKNSGYLSARSTKSGYNDLTDLDPYTLKANVWDCKTRVKEANKWVDIACRRRTWLIECLHLVGNSNRVKYRHFTHVDDLKKHLNYLANRHVWVTTQRDVIESFPNGT